MKSKHFKWFWLCATILFLAGTTACDSGSSEESIPEDVLHAARGMLGLLSDAIFEGPAGSDAPTLIISESGTTMTIAFFDYSPEPGFLINGEANADEVSASPYQLSVAGSFSITGGLSATIVIEASAFWPPGLDKDDQPPSVITGSFVYNGKPYDIARIMEILNARDSQPAGGEPL